MHKIINCYFYFHWLIMLKYLMCTFISVSEFRYLGDVVMTALMETWSPCCDTLVNNAILIFHALNS